MVLRKWYFAVVFIAAISVSVNGQVDYGADTANASFFGGASGGGGSYNYLALRDHIGPSGVPLGGIGTGCFGFGPDGRFTRIALNCTHEDGVIKDTRAGFFAIWEKNFKEDHPVLRRLVRDEGQYGDMHGYAHSTYRGLFPAARISFEDDRNPQPMCRVSIHGYSGLVPHNIKDSALPVAFFEVTLVNPKDRPMDVSIALSFEDIIGRRIADAQDLEQLKNVKENSAWHIRRIDWGWMDRVETYAEPIEIGTYKGVRQFTEKPFIPNKATFQNYLTDVAILAENEPDVEITALPAYAVDNADAAWQEFRDSGKFSEAAGKTPLYDPEQRKEAASAIAMNVSLKGAETRTIRFMITWYYPELVMPDDVHPNQTFPSSDFGRYFHNYFNDLESLVTYAAANRERILDQTLEWQKPILESTYPEWLKFKLINSSYVIYTNSILNRSGDFTIMEGAMGGLAGTMDQRISSHPLYQKMFTELDRSEMMQFAASQDPEGYILHFDGHYYIGIANKKGDTPTPKGTMLDNTGGWLIQLAKDYQQTGDIDYLKANAENAKKALAYLKDQIKGDIQIPQGNTTYDDYSHPPLYSYITGMYLATLRAGEVIAEGVGDETLKQDCAVQFKKTQKDFIRYLWNGRFFSYGCDEDGSNPQDYRMFTGQLGGQFVSRYCKWGDVVPFEMARAAVLAQFKTSLKSAPNYYTNKVYDLNIHSGIDNPGSRCWPFYLESYTAMLGMQCGYVQDCFDIMRNIQLVHLQKGYTWTQNLWNVNEVTYMTAPVTWFVTDCLAGSGLNVPEKKLYVAPVILPGQTQLKLPIFMPKFWGMLDIDKGEKTIKLEITHMIDDADIEIDTIIAEPIGKPADKRKTIRFRAITLRKGLILDLSQHWDKLIDGTQRPWVLPRAEQIPFIEIENPYKAD